MCYHHNEYTLVFFVHDKWFYCVLYDCDLWPFVKLKYLLLDHGGFDSGSWGGVLCEACVGLRDGL
jgi:hypothetical protein